MKVKRTLIRVALCLVICLFLGSIAMAATLNVPGDYLTIGDAVTAASNGDIINVLPGSYPGNITVNKSVSIRGVGDTGSGPKSDILGQASAGIRTDHCLEFPV